MKSLITRDQGPHVAAVRSYRQPQCRSLSIFRLGLCQPMTPVLPIIRAETSVGHRFFGQLSGKLPPASVLYIWCQDRSTIGVEKLRVQNPYRGRAPAWVGVRWRLTDKSDFQLAASMFKKDHFFDHII